LEKFAKQYNVGVDLLLYNMSDELGDVYIEALIKADASREALEREADDDAEEDRESEPAEMNDETFEAMAIVEGWTVEEAPGDNQDVGRVKAQKVNELWSWGQVGALEPFRGSLAASS
jgi:hypothetical protein